MFHVGLLKRYRGPTADARRTKSSVTNAQRSHLPSASGSDQGQAGSRRIQNKVSSIQALPCIPCLTDAVLERPLHADKI
jgi:hypothetical protein